MRRSSQRAAVPHTSRFCLCGAPSRPFWNVEDIARGKCMGHPPRKGTADSLSILLARFLWLATLAVTTAICGCSGGNDRTVWSAKSIPPDGQFVATAYRNVPSGIGTGDFGTSVYLNWTDGSQSPTIILSFQDGADRSSGDKTVGMNWLSSRHLELTYKAPRTIDFQAIKCHSVDISVRDLSSPTRDTHQ